MFQCYDIRSEKSEFLGYFAECYDATVSMGALTVAMLFSLIVGIAYAAKLRTAIRKQHGIKGGFSIPTFENTVSF